MVAHRHTHTHTLARTVEFTAEAIWKVGVYGYCMCGAQRGTTNKAPSLSDNHTHTQLYTHTHTPPTHHTKHTHTQIYTHTQTHTPTHKHTHTHTHRYTHTHTQGRHRFLISTTKCTNKI